MEKKWYNVTVLGETDSYFSIELSDEELSIIKKFLDEMNENISSWDQLSITFDRIK